ncbi:breast cancer metastasis-suppressor 1 homolog isoform X2 [Pristis pectinata]|uniref:breast cancer metastasis-suppressor 1 homolog isoform X2 n=1 Tax=Pristis pectinata TaxID=685728 RepID=UPI00223DF0AD|nr:breast cancer metastasis-suppressor 1 homolog isoform X2 [Pristis pectinata]
MPGQQPQRDKEKDEEKADEEMEQDSPENEESSDEDSASTSASEEEGEDSSEMDDEDCERRRTECLDEMSDLEKQFTDLKEQLYKERLSQVEAKLDEVIAGKATEYLEPLAVLQKNMKIRTEVAGVYKDLCSEVIRNRYECELQGARQHLESEKLLLFDNMQNELLERIQRLEEDKQSIDITSEWWNEEVRGKRNKKKSDTLKPEKKKKAATVSGPYIVYMLRDIDILEDWAAIKKAKAVISQQKRKSDGAGSEATHGKKAKVSAQLLSDSVLPKQEKHLYMAKCEDGRLFYEGDWYTKGQSIVLEMKDETPSHAMITAVSTGEVWLRRSDGSKTKLYVSQLQKGKYSIHKA